MIQDPTTKISYALSAFYSIVGALKLNEWALIIGIILGISTFALNWVYQQKNYKLNLKNSKKPQE